MKVRILSSGRRDLIAGKEFYDFQGREVGNYFFESVSKDLDSLEKFGGIHSKLYGLHRMLASHFPFGIFYEKRGEEIIVFRILDLRKNPKEIRKLLNE